MEAYSIVGGVPLCGEAAVYGAKNAVLPLMAACMLVRGQIKLSGCPDLSDVRSMSRVLESFGCKAAREGRELIVDSADAAAGAMPETLSKKMRSSIFLLGPVLARFGQADFTYPGGCEIGLRPIDLHLQGLRALGAQIEEKHGHILCSGALHGSEVHLDYPSVGATENVMMAACGAAGDTVIHNAAREPEIVDLGRFLNACGARVRGMGTDSIRISGRDAPLHGCTYAPLPDRICAGTLLCGAAITGGDVYVRDAREQDLSALLHKLRETGCEIHLPQGGGVRAIAPKRLRAVRRIETAPFPGFPTDMQAQMSAVLTRARGTSVVVENVFENRMGYAAELCRMGADIQISGRTAVIRGVKALDGARVCARDLRGGAALCLAALAAQGESLVEGVELIDRGHDKLEDTLLALGGSIRRITEEQ